MNNETKEILENLQASQKWDCYTSHQDGYILEAGWPYMPFGIEKVYGQDVYELANARSMKKWVGLMAAAENSEAKSEQEFAVEAIAKGIS